MNQPIDISNPNPSAGDYKEVFQSFYQEESLAKNMDSLCDSKKPISDRTILNLIIKYFHVYFQKESPAQSLSLDDVANSFSDFMKELHNGAVTDNSYAHYALKMIHDIFSTAHIFRDIISRKVSSDLIDNNSYGLDLGSGTGILMLAQHILATRNNFRDKVKLIGIEIHEKIAQLTETFFSKLHIGEIFYENAMLKDTYNFLNGNPLFFVANETIPTYTSPIFHEPFLFVNVALFETVKEEQVSDTNFFPQSLVLSQNSTNKKLESEYNILNQKNKFYPRNPNFLYPTHMVLDNNFLWHLSDIGNPFKRYIPNNPKTRFCKRW